MEVFLHRGKYCIDMRLEGRRIRKVLSADKEAAELLATTYHRFAIVARMLNQDPKLRRLVTEHLDPSGSKGYVYFIQSGNTVKIGWARDVKRRLRQIQVSTHEEVVLRKSLFGERGLEAEQHKRFAHLRLRGEWFEHRGELAMFLNRSKT